MTIHVTLRLYATLSEFAPPDADRHPINPGITVRRLLEDLAVPVEKAKLVFIDGAKGELDSLLCGGERIGVFPPVGGG